MQRNGSLAKRPEGKVLLNGIELNGLDCIKIERL
jgi:hypothetical protein